MGNANMVAIGGGGGGGGVLPGAADDTMWTCEYAPCGKPNFEWAETCKYCGRDRPSWYCKWTCTTCGYSNNFPSRKDCFKCKQLKPKVYGDPRIEYPAEDSGEAAVSAFKDGGIDAMLAAAKAGAGEDAPPADNGDAGAGPKGDAALLLQAREKFDTFPVEPGSLRGRGGIFPSAQISPRGGPPRGGGGFPPPRGGGFPPRGGGGGFPPRGGGGDGDGFNARGRFPARGFSPRGFAPGPGGFRGRGGGFGGGPRMGGDSFNGPPGDAGWDPPGMNAVPPPPPPGMDGMGGPFGRGGGFARGGGFPRGGRAGGFGGPVGDDDDGCIGLIAAGVAALAKARAVGSVPPPGAAAAHQPAPVPPPGVPQSEYGS